MTVTALPTPPSRLDPPDTFITNADAFLKALPTFGTELNSLQADVQNKATQAATATDAMNTALAASNVAQAAAAASAWASGTTYALNKVAISQVNFQSYRRIVAGAGTIDPANDPTNWILLYGNDANGAFLPIVAATTAIDLSKGNYFTRTTNGADSFTFNNCPALGYSFTLEVAMTSGSVSWPPSVKSPADSVPTLNSGKTHLFMFVTSNGGARWRVTIAPNYVT